MRNPRHHLRIALAFLVLFFLAIDSAWAGWYSNCAACKKHLGGSGRMGPFSSQSACESARASGNFPWGSCYQLGGSSGGSSSNSYSGLEAAAYSAGEAVGGLISNLLFGDPQKKAQERAQRELEAQRAAEAARRRAEEAARRREQEHQALLSALLPVPGSAAAPAPDSASTGSQGQTAQAVYAAAWEKGLLDAEQCYPSNTFGYCAMVTPAEYENCVKGYQDGFASGDKQRELRMEAAYRIGVAAVYSDEGDDAFNHPDAQGPCRIQWTQAYNRGHFQGKTERTAANQ